jgi:hypothetical protein
VFGAHIASQQERFEPPRIQQRKWLTTQAVATHQTERIVTMPCWIESLLTWIDKWDSRALERYLAQSANVADLERRMRDWEIHSRDAFNYPV